MQCAKHSSSALDVLLRHIYSLVSLLIRSRKKCAFLRTDGGELISIKVVHVYCAFGCKGVVGQCDDDTDFCAFTQVSYEATELSIKCHTLFSNAFTVCSVFPFVNFATFASGNSNTDVKTIN